MHHVDDYNDTYLPTYVQVASSTGEVVYEEIDESAITGFTVSTNCCLLYSPQTKTKLILIKIKIEAKTRYS